MVQLLDNVLELKKKQHKTKTPLFTSFLRVVLLINCFFSSAAFSMSTVARHIIADVDLVCNSPEATDSCSYSLELSEIKQRFITERLYSFETVF